MTNEQLQLLSVTSLHPDPDNRDIGDVEGLAESIKQAGVLQPIVARPNRDGFQIVVGERRWTAAQVAGLTEVPVIVRDMTDREAAEAQLIENLERKDIEPLEEATAYKRLLGFGVKQAEIADKIGRSPGHISKRLALLELPDVAKTALSGGTITLDDAAALLKLKTMPKITKAALELGKQWSNMPRAIEHTIREHEKAQRRGLVEHDLKEKGVKILAERPGWDAKARPLGKTEYRSIGITTAKHKKEPCHAAYVDDYDQKAVYVCTDPGRHTAKGASSLKLPKGVRLESSSTTSPAAKRERETRKALKAAAVERRKTAAKLVGGRTLKTADTFALVAGVLIRSARGYGDVSKIARTLLAIDDSTFDSLVDQTDDSGERTALAVLAAKSPDDLRRVAIAVAVATMEVDLASTWQRDWRHLQEYFFLLERFGYDPTDVEERRLAGQEKGR